MMERIRQTYAGLAKINKLKRSPAPISKLCLGMECGASDGFSGISANPAMGHTADLVVASGGRVILGIPRIMWRGARNRQSMRRSRNRYEIH